MKHNKKKTKIPLDKPSTTKLCFRQFSFKYKLKRSGHILQQKQRVELKLQKEIHVVAPEHENKRINKWQQKVYIINEIKSCSLKLHQ